MNKVVWTVGLADDRFLLVDSDQLQTTIHRPGIDEWENKFTLGRWSPNAIWISKRVALSV